MTFAALLSFTALAAGGLASASNTALPACDVGEAALLRLLAALPEQGALIISAQPVPRLELRSSNFSGREGSELPSALINEWGATAPSNLLESCPHLEDRLPSGWRYAKPGEEAPINRPTIHFVATPLVRGNVALVQVGFVCRGLCGMATIDIYHRTAEGWRYVAPAAATIS